MRQQRHGIDQKPMAFPTAQRRDDADQRNIGGKPESAPRGNLVSGSETHRIDAGGYRCHALGRDAQIANEMLSDRLARSHDLRRGLAIEPSRHRVARYRGRDMPRSDQRRRTLAANSHRAAGKRGEPAIGRAVRIDDVDRMLGQKARQRQEPEWALARHRKRIRAHAIAARFGENARVRRADELNAVSARDHSGSFGQNAYLLTAPSERCFRVQYAHVQASFAVGPARLAPSPQPPSRQTGCGTAWRRRRRGREARRVCPARRRVPCRAPQSGRRVRSSTGDAR